MLRRIIKIGSSVGNTLSLLHLEKLGLKVGDPIQVECDRECITIRPLVTRTQTTLHTTPKLKAEDVHKLKEDIFIKKLTEEALSGDVLAKEKLRTGIVTRFDLMGIRLPGEKEDEDEEDMEDEKE